MKKTKKPAPPTPPKLRAPGDNDNFYCAWEACAVPVHVFADGIPFCRDHYSERFGATGGVPKAPLFYKAVGERYHQRRIDGYTKALLEDQPPPGITLDEMHAKYKNGKAVATKQPESEPMPETTAEVVGVEDGLESGKYDEW